MVEGHFRDQSEWLIYKIFLNLKRTIWLQKDTINWVITPKYWRPTSPSVFLAWLGPRFVKASLLKTTSSQGHRMSLIMSWSWVDWDPTHHLSSTLYSILLATSKQRVWHWVGLLHSSIVQHQIPRDQSRSMLLNQRQADSKWRARRQRAFPCCCWKGRSPLIPDTICGRRDEKMPPEIEESQSQQGAWTGVDKIIININPS